MFGALAYNQNKVDSGEAKVLFSNRMLLSEDGNFSIGGCMRSFEMQMPVQLSTKKPILHISINPHPEDVLTDQQLSDIAREYCFLSSLAKLVGFMEIILHFKYFFVKEFLRMLCGLYYKS